MLMQYYNFINFKTVVSLNSNSYPQSFPRQYKKTPLPPAEQVKTEIWVGWVNYAMKMPVTYEIGEITLRFHSCPADKRERTRSAIRAEVSC